MDDPFKMDATWTYVFRIWVIGFIISLAFTCSYLLSMEIEDIIFKNLFKIDYDNLVANAVLANENEIIRLNQTQLAIGEDSEGNSLGEYANFAYKNRWAPVDLFLTGDYWRSKKLEISPDGKYFIMVAYDEKAKMLQDRYSKNIEGISEQGINDIPDLIRENMQLSFREELG